MTSFEIMNSDSMNSSWSLHSRLKLALAAAEFFDVENATKMAQYVHDDSSASGPSGSPPFSLLDFARYLETRGIFSKKPNHLRVQNIVSRMAAAGLLVQVGYSGGSPPLFGERYMHFRGMFGEHFRGNLWLASLLGPELLYEEAKLATVHITGTKKDEVVGGTGVVIHPNYILTCRHVVDGIVVDCVGSAQASSRAVDSNSVLLHPTRDVALIHVEEPLNPLNGAVFREPLIAQAVYAVGYPKLPNMREASLTIQPGAITAERVTSLAGETLFLYSAIARPGNSGGPILSSDGYVVGLAVEDHLGSYGEQPFSPHYAGIPAWILVEAVEELTTDIELVVENLD